MLRSVRPALLLPLLLMLSTASRAEEGLVGAWLRARAREHLVHAQPPAEPHVGPGDLWRERAPGEAPLPDFVPPTSLAPLIRAVQAGVVNITTQGALGEGSKGSGFILNPQGLVVTNHHVVAQAQRIAVRLGNGREFQAQVVGRDPATDVALLQLRGVEREALPAVFLGDSDQLEVGDWVVAIGNPFGLSHSVSHGLISAKERVLGMGLFDEFLQTDALINPGNSGGPLFNMRGEVVGVNTAVISGGQGIGFAVPINMVKDLLPSLRANGRPERAWLGVLIQEAPAGGGAQRVAMVQEVVPGSPAAAAGIQPGDRVVAVNGRRSDSYQQLLRRVTLLSPGTEVRLTLLRGGEPLEVAVRLAARPTRQALQEAMADLLERWGLALQDLTAEAAQSLGRPAYSGVLVAGVVPRSRAEAAGLRPGDVVLEINRRRVKDMAGARAALERRSSSGVLLLVQRGDLEQYVVLAP